MQKWLGSSGVCINENGELLMVLEGRPDEEKTWSIPSGGLEANETLEECCIREIFEETGYVAEVIEKLWVKTGVYEEINISFEVHYFFMKIVGGEMNIQDPDQLIHEIAWKNIDEIKELSLGYPEDREFLIDCLKEKALF